MKVHLLIRDTENVFKTNISSNGCYELKLKNYDAYRVSQFYYYQRNDNSCIVILFYTTIQV